MNDLRDLLELSTDAIASPGRADAALVGARRRRTRRRGAVVAAAVVVVVAGVAVAGHVGGDELAPMPAPAPAPTVTVSSAPGIPAARVATRWDPRDAEGRAVVDLGVPRVMETLTPGPVDRPVAVLDDGSSARLVSADGLVADLAVPPGLGSSRTVTLSPDGTRLAAVGVSGFFWRGLDGDWQRVDVGDHSIGEGIEVTWAPDSSSLVLRSHLAGTHVDLTSGAVQRWTMLRNHESWGFAPDGSVVTTGRPSVREWSGDTVTRETGLGPLDNLQRPAVGDASLAAARSGWDRPRTSPADADGLVALERGSLRTRGLLPVPGDGSSYVDGGNLTPIDWLDDDTVLFTVLPEGAPKRYLMTWDVTSGDISRISCWSAADDAVFATDLLARR